MFVIAENCLLGEQYLHQFGMGAWFGDELQINIATVLGILIVIVWIGGYILLFCLIYPRVNLPAFEWFLQHPDYRGHVPVNLAKDPWLTSVNDKGQNKHRELDLARDPFDTANLAGIVPQNPYNSSFQPGVGANSAHSAGMQPYQQQYNQKERGGSYMSYR